MNEQRAQVDIDDALDKAGMRVEPFQKKLVEHRLDLTREKTHTLQINLGYLCNQVCRHCHLDAGPGRKENMDRSTVEAVVAYAERGRFDTVDITGGAPELNPHIEVLIENLAGLDVRIMLRSNLSVLTDGRHDDLIQLLKKHRVVIVASFPALNQAQVDSQRGKGIFETSVAAIRQLNDIGYGRSDAGWELNLVSNPTGAFLPPDQVQMEKRFRDVLKRKWGLEFNHLYNFANVPLGRFRQWLETSGNLTAYLKKLAASFNPCAVPGVMCRSLVSVGWDGVLYDCDFNLARGLFMGHKRVHVDKLDGPPEPGSPIATGDHCYTCTAGAGFT
jgi:radical SAM/Cys-rich protein